MDLMTRYVGILSGKGGVAKTTSTVNLGAAFNYFGRDVTIVDGNLSTPNLGLHLGVPVVPISLHDVLKGKNDILESVYKHNSGLKIIPASLSLDDLKDVKPENLGKILMRLDGLTDIVLIDGAPGIGGDALTVINAVEDVIIVTNPELPAITDALKISKFVEGMGKNVKGIILSKTGEDHDLSEENVEKMLDSPIIATIPYDKAIRKSLVMKEPVIYCSPRSKSAVAYKKLAADLIGIEYNEKAEGRLGRLFRKIGFKG
jgi:septum site-determining protein MinD